MPATARSITATAQVHVQLEHQTSRGCRACLRDTTRAVPDFPGNSNDPRSPTRALARFRQIGTMSSTFVKFVPPSSSSSMQVLSVSERERRKKAPEELPRQITQCLLRFFGTQGSAVLPLAFFFFATTGPLFFPGSFRSSGAKDP